MGSSDQEEDVEGYIDKALDEEGQGQRPGSDLGHLEEFSEEYLFEDKVREPAVLDEQQEEESQSFLDLEDLEEFVEEPSFETKAPRPAVPDEPEEQESQPGSDEERLGELKDEYPFEEGPEQAGEGETEVDTQELDLRPKKKREKGRRRVVASVATVLIALIAIGVGYLYLKQEGIAVSPNQGTGPGQSVSIAIPREEILALDSFVIPAEGNKNLTYVFLSISIKLPNKEVKREFTEKESSLRGIIYDTLVREIANTKDVPPPESLKEFIIRGVNGALSTGRISEVFISKFLAL